MKRTFLFLFFIIAVFPAFAHGGEDHGAEKAATPSGSKYFSSEVSSDKYEVLVKYNELEGGKPATLMLFLADAKTNRAIGSADISIKIAGLPNAKWDVSATDTGIYQLAGTFPANQVYDLQVNISSPSGPDFLQVSKIEVGKKLEVVSEEHSHWYDNPLIWAIAGVIVGLLLMYILMQARFRKSAAVAIIFSLIIPTASMNPTMAHDGEDHGAGAKSTGSLSSSFLVEKESQFLFNIHTQPMGSGSFYHSNEILGTVTPAPQGSAVIQSPQTGKIISLKVTPGQSVTKGQTLALVEQQVEAGTQIDIISQRNTLNAEVKAAKAQYDRLQSISDIAAKKDVIEAKSRYEAAVQNLQLFNASIGRGASTKTITLTAPITGVVGTFNYAIGAVVSAGQTLFEITNLNRVYVEAQVFPQNLEATSGRFIAFATGDTAAYNLRLVSKAQAVNTENQSQRVVFEVMNPEGKFRIGENVRVLQYGNERVSQLVVPTTSIVEVNGKPAVFIKDKAEQFSISFIQKGESNPLHTVIIKGAESGEKIVTENVYQMKMIYLGQ